VYRSLDEPHCRLARWRKENLYSVVFWDLHSVGWILTDVSKMPIWDRYVVPKRRCETNLCCVTSQKTTEFRQTAAEAYHVTRKPLLLPGTEPGSPSHYWFPQPHFLQLFHYATNFNLPIFASKCTPISIELLLSDVPRYSNSAPYANVLSNYSCGLDYQGSIPSRVRYHSRHHVATHLAFYPIIPRINAVLSITSTTPTCIRVVVKYRSN
jgi:hypothetical protein